MPPSHVTRVLRFKLRRRPGRNGRSRRSTPQGGVRSKRAGERALERTPASTKNDIEGEALGGRTQAGGRPATAMP